MEYNLIPEYLTQERGFSWGKHCNNWVMYTMWEPDVLRRIQFLKAMRPRIDTSSTTGDGFWGILKSGFATFEMKLDSIVDPASNYVVARIDWEDEYPEPPEPSNSLNNHVIKVSEFICCSGYMTLRCTPLNLVCGGSLADILKGTLRHNDILIAIGTVKRVDTPDCGRVTLLNFDDLDGDMVLIRFSFLPPRDKDVKLLESITPTAYPNNFNFKYRLRHGRELTTLRRSGNYRWEGPSVHSSSWSEIAQLIDGVTLPLKSDEDIGDVYRRLKRSSSRSPVRLPHLPQKPAPVFVPRSRIPIRKTAFQGLKDVPLCERDSPIFSAKLGSTHLSEANYGSRNPRRFSTSDVCISKVSDFWTMICFLLIVLIACTLMYWVVEIWTGPMEVGNNCRRPNFKMRRITMQNNNDNALTHANREMSYTCRDDDSIFTIIMDRIKRVFLWIRENTGLGFILEKLFGNDNSAILDMPIV